jgi:hypothetical protein
MLATRCVCLIRHKPSRRFTDITRVKRIFTDVFSGHTLDIEFDTFIGKMFRFSLGDENMARYSELSNQIITLETIDRLFARFRPDMFNYSQFLNSLIQSIQLKKIDESISEFVRLNRW